jgi:hypothetical protein
MFTTVVTADVCCLLLMMMFFICRSGILHDLTVNAYFTFALTGKPQQNDAADK